MKPDTFFYLPYGSERLPLSLPDHCEQLQVQEPQKVITPASFQKRLQNFLKQNPLDLSQPILVVADKQGYAGIRNICLY